MAGADTRLESAKKAGKVLSYAVATGDPLHHAEMVYNEIAQRAEVILREHPTGTLSQAQKDAICELLASTILTTSLMSQPKERWIGRLYREFCRQGPFEQIGSALKVFAVLGVLSAFASGVFYGTPTAVKWLSDQLNPSQLPAAAPEGGNGPANGEPEIKP